MTTSNNVLDLSYWSLFLVRDVPAASRSIVAAERMSARMGFGPPKILTADDTVVYVYPKRRKYCNFRVRQLLATCGIFVFRGAIGEAALKIFYDIFDGAFAQLHEAYCHRKQCSAASYARRVQQEWNEPPRRGSR